MNRVRLYVDEDAVVEGLRARGVDVLTTMDARRCGTSDREQLAFAAQEGRSIYTFNVGHFARLHGRFLREGVDHCGIVVLPDQRYSVGEKIRRIAGFLSHVTATDMVNRMEFL